MLSKVIFTGLLALMIGIILGLILRITQENISPKYFCRAFRLSINYLLIYPFILFPFLVYCFKEDIAEIFANKILNSSEQKYKKTKKQLKKDIKKQLTFINIIRMWLNFIKLISSDYDKYIDININLVKEVIIKESYNKKQRYYIKHQTEVDELYQFAI